MRVFVTGATGFAGSHLVEQLLANGDEVWGLIHHATSHQAIPSAPNFRVVEGDLLDLKGVRGAIEACQPDVIYHLAGQAYPARSWNNPSLTLAINTGGTANILDAAVRVGGARVLVVTSADIYGKVRPNQLPLTERSHPKPRHPYGISKWAAGQLVRVYADRYELPVVEARPFNHIGPRQALGFVVPDFASQVTAIRLGLRERVLRVGNLSAQRDFTDVRDVVAAYQKLANCGKRGEAYLICSGQPVAIHTLLNILLEINEVEAEVEYDPERMRPSDVPLLYGSHTKITGDVGWKPQIHLRQSLGDVSAEWLNLHQKA